jgi:hypothetical protein
MTMPKRPTYRNAVAGVPNPLPELHDKVGMTECVKSFESKQQGLCWWISSKVDEPNMCEVTLICFDFSTSIAKRSERSEA